MRRRITLLALVTSSALLAACSDTTAPVLRSAPAKPASRDLVCLSGYTTSSGEFVCTEWGDGN